MISFIMPAKDASLYIRDAVEAVRKAPYTDWELIVIEDHSTDDTLSILRELEKANDRIKVFVNTGKGKVQGLNFGYSLSKGNLIKCIDADDVLDPGFFEMLPDLRKYAVSCHDAYITDENLKKASIYNIDRAIINCSFGQCLRSMKSLPRWTWTFTRDLADKILPMPEDLPFEDIWFSLIIKRYAEKIDYVNKPLYHYRQHGNQTFGGILNFTYDIVAFRAKRILKFIEVIKNEPTQRLVFGIETDGMFDEILCFNTLLIKKNLTMVEIAKSPIGLTLRIKLLIYRKLSAFAPLFIRAKWFWDKRC